MRSSRPPRVSSPAALPALLRASHVLGLALGSALGKLRDTGVTAIPIAPLHSMAGMADMAVPPALSMSRLGYGLEMIGAVGVQWELRGAVARRTRLTPSVSSSIPARRQAFWPDGKGRHEDAGVGRRVPAGHANDDETAGLCAPKGIAISIAPLHAPSSCHS